MAKWLEGRKMIAVDLDGTLAKYDGWKGISHIGDPFPGAREFMDKLCDRFHVVVYTTRTNYRVNKRPDTIKNAISSKEWARGLKRKIEEWLLGNCIPCHEVYDGNGKPMAAAFVDDRAVPCSGNPDEAEYGRMLTAATALALGVDNGLTKLPQ